MTQTSEAQVLPKPVVTPASRRSFFASRTVPEHLVRGVCGLGLGGLAFWLFAWPGVLPTLAGAVALTGAVILLRGCPTCWLTGLCATIEYRARTKDPT